MPIEDHHIEDLARNSIHHGYLVKSIPSGGGILPEYLWCWVLYQNFLFSQTLPPIEWRIPALNQDEYGINGHKW